jgi:hypothetical protein
VRPCVDLFLLALSSLCTCVCAVLVHVSWPLVAPSRGGTGAPSSNNGGASDGHAANGSPRRVRARAITVTIPIYCPLLPLPLPNPNATQQQSLLTTSPIVFIFLPRLCRLFDSSYVDSRLPQFGIFPATRRHGKTG